MRSRWARVVGSVVLVATLSGACGGDDDEEESGLEEVEFASVGGDMLPAMVLDLAVTPEQPTTRLEAGQETYIDALGFFSFRRDDLLQATLQINRFNEEARVEEESFRRLIAGQISTGGSPTIVRVGEQRVYITSTGQQTVAVWFDDDRHGYVLSIREEYEQPRALMRTLVELGAEA